MEIGELLGGKYRVERVLGRGGQGEVVQATNLLLGQSVAMKFLLPEMSRDQVLVQRFLREARAAVQLKSEHVARVLDVGTLDNAAPYIVFEYLDGADLSRWQSDALTLGVIVDFALQAIEALAEAHSKGIVHRDIKPANLFITSTSDGVPCLKVLDFGISKVETLVGMAALTASYTMLGTPTYASPEQLVSSSSVDHRTDIWSLGVVLYELVEGRLPYNADSLTQLAVKVMTEPLPPLTAQIPAPIAAAITRCLEKDPARRFQSMGELSRALAPFAGSTEHAAMLVRRAIRISTPVIEEPYSSVSHASLAPASRSRRGWLIPVVSGAVVGVVLVALLVARGGTKHESAAPDRGTEVHEMQTQPSQVMVAAVDAQMVAETPVDAPADAVDESGAVAQTQRRVADALTAVVAWTAAHPSEACPSIKALGSGVPSDDAWESPLIVTCKDQPADQIAGVISAGADRKLGTDDDVRSWSLASDVVAIAKGPRFTPKRAPPGPVSRTKRTHKAAKPTGKGKKPTPTIVDRDGDGIPDVR